MIRVHHRLNLLHSILRANFIYSSFDNIIVAMVTFTGDSVTGKVSINYRLSISSSSMIADSLADLWRDVSGQTSFFPHWPIGKSR